MNNWEMAQKATETAIYSQGSAMRENAQYMQSYEARINQLKNSFTELSVAVGKAVLSGGMSALINGLTSLANVAVKVVENVGALPPVLLAVYALMSKMGVFAKFKENFLGGLYDNSIGRFTAEYKKAVSEINGTKLQAVRQAWSNLRASMDEARNSANKAGDSINHLDDASRKAASGVSFLGRTLRAVFIESLIGAAIVGIGYGIEKLAQAYQKQKASAEQMKKMNEQMVDNYRQSGDGLKGLVSRYEELKNKSHLTTKEQEEFSRVQKQLVQDLPTAVSYIDANGEAHLKSAKAIEKERKVVEELSKEQAKLEQAKFKKEIDKQAESYDKVVKKVKDLIKQQKEWQQQDGKKVTEMVGLEGVVTYTADNKKKIQQSKVDILMAEAEKTEAIKKTIKAINDQALAYMNAQGKLAGLGDMQQKAVEQFIASNEEMLRKASSPKQFEKMAKQLFVLGTKVGDVFYNAYKKMAKGLEDQPTKLEQIKKQLGQVAQALPEDFFKLGKNRDINDVTRQLKGIIEVSKQVKNGSGDWDGLVSKLKKLGLSSKDAQGMLANLARTQNNEKLASEAQKQGVEEVAGAIQDMAEAAIDAVDPLEQLFGIKSDNIKGMQTHIQTLQILQQEYGNAAKSTDAWKSAVSDLSIFLGVSENEVVRNLDYYAKIIDALTKLQIKTDDAGKAQLDFSNMSKAERDALQELINKMGGTRSIIDVLVGKTNKLKDASNENAKAQDNQKKKTDEMGNSAQKAGDKVDHARKTIEKLNTVDLSRIKGSLYYAGDGADKLGQKYESARKKWSQGGESSFLKTLNRQLSTVGSGIVVTQDKFGVFKVRTNQGGSSPYLQNLENILNDLGGKYDLVRDKHGKFKLVVSQNGSSMFITNVNGQLRVANSSVANVKGNYIKLRSEIQTGGGKSKALSEHNEQLDNVSAGYRAVQDVMKNFSKTHPTLPSLVPLKKDLNDASKKAKTTKKDTDETAKSAKKVKDATKEIDKINQKINEAKASVKKFNREVNKMGDGASTAKLRKELSKAGDSANDAKKKIAGLVKEVKKVGDNAKTGAINNYAKAIQKVVSSASKASSYSKSTASAQSKIADSFRSVTNSIKTYSSSISRSGSSVASAYSRMASSISKASNTINSSYRKNKSSLNSLTITVEKDTKSIISDFNTLSKKVVPRIQSMTSSMYSTFKKGSKQIASAAGQIPSQIGDAVRKHMNEATDAMDALAKNMVKRFKKELGIHSPSKVFTELGGWVIKGLVNGLQGEDLKELGKNVFEEFGGGVFDSWETIKAFLSANDLGEVAKGSVKDWLVAAIGATGVGMDWLQPLYQMAMKESGGNPRAINLWDSNAKAGHPSKGLMQTIDPTFNAYKLPGFDDIWNPVHNAIAAIRYIKARYGSIWNTPGIKSMASGRGYRGYANGGIIDKMELAWHGEEGKEAIIPLIPKRRKRGLELWQQTGEMLGVSPAIMELVKKYIETLQGRKSAGGSGFDAGSGSFSTSSGESSGGESLGGGDTGSSGSIVHPQMTYASSYNMDGGFDIVALATSKKHASKSAPKPAHVQDLPEAYKSNPLERTAEMYDFYVKLVDSSLQNLTKNTVAYRDTVKSLIAYENSYLKTLKQQLSATYERNNVIKRSLKTLPPVSKQNAAQRELYNNLMQEYDQNLSKIYSLRLEISQTMSEIKSKSVEIFTDFIGEIVQRYDTAINAIKDKVDNTDFQIEVLNLTNPDDTQSLLNAQIEKAKLLQTQQATGKDKLDALQSQYNAIVKKKGVNSAEAIATKEELDKAKEEYEDYTLAVLNAEKEMKDTRVKIADDAIQKLQDYYKNMKDMALNAIETEKDALQKAHDKKMKLYDDEINKINAIYDAKLKSLDQQKQEDDYEEQLNEKNKKRADFVNKISILSRNGTLDGKKRVADLKQQLEDLDKEIADLQKQHETDLLKQQLEDQRNAELQSYNGGYDEYGNYIKGLKELEDKQLQDRLDELEKEKDAISKHYDDLINDERRWAEMRNQAIRGNFSTIQTELTNMTDNLNKMNQGIFDNLTTSFATFADEVKQKIAELNQMAIDSMLYNVGDVVDAVKGASNSNNYTMTNGVNQNNGTKILTPNVTTPPKTTTSKPTTTKPSTPTTSTSTGTQYYTVQKGDTFWDIENKLGLAHGTLAKLNPTVNPNKLQAGQKLVVKKGTTSSSSSSGSTSSSSDRKVTTALNMRSSPAYGNNVITTIPKNAKVEYLGMVNGWAKIKHNGKIGYVGSQYLAKFDTGGYTGDDIPKEGALGILHRKELVLNEKQTSDILDTVKIMDKMTSILPDIERSNFVQRIAEGIGNTNIVNNYELTVNIDKLGAGVTEKEGNMVANVILKGLRKRGR